VSVLPTQCLVKRDAGGVALLTCVAVGGALFFYILGWIQRGWRLEARALEEQGLNPVLPTDVTEMRRVRVETGMTAGAHNAQPLGTKESVDALVERARAESLDDMCPICLDVLDGHDIAVLNCPGKACGKMHVTCAGDLLTKSDFCSACRSTVSGFSEVYHRGARKRPRDESDGGNT